MITWSSPRASSCFLNFCFFLFYLYVHIVVVLSAPVLLYFVRGRPFVFLFWALLYCYILYGVVPSYFCSERSCTVIFYTGSSLRIFVLSAPVLLYFVRGRPFVFLFWALLYCYILYGVVPSYFCSERSCTVIFCTGSSLRIFVLRVRLALRIFVLRVRLAQNIFMLVYFPFKFLISYYILIICLSARTNVMQF